MAWTRRWRSYGDGILTDGGTNLTVVHFDVAVNHSGEYRGQRWY